MEETERYAILNKIIETYYPELEGTAIELEESWFIKTSSGIIPNFFGGIGTLQDKEKHIIFYDDDGLEHHARYVRIDIEKAYKGLFAHELSHISKKENKEKQTLRRRIIQNLREKIPAVNTFLENWDDCKCDDDVIRRGLGEELLAIKTVLHGNYETSGYTKDNVKTLLKYHANKKRKPFL